MKALCTLMVAFGFLLSPLLASAQEPEVTIYETYEDFVAKKGTNYDAYVTYAWALGKVTLQFSLHGEKEKVKCSNIWGFRYRDALFRIDEENAQPAKLINYGRLCYYENGLAHLQMMRDSTTTGQFAVGASCYVSLDLKDKLYGFTYQKKETKKARAHFLEADRVYTSYFDCVGYSYAVDVIRKCVEQFETDHPKEN